MKTALVTTTVNIPHVLRLYRRCDPDVRFFIAGDQKSPHADIQLLADQMGNTKYIWPRNHDYPSWQCSDLIGPNCIQRRNIATLEALRWGADIIVFVDDDNIPIGTDYFQDYQSILGFKRSFKYKSDRTLEDHKEPHAWHGLLASPETDWFDIGAFLDPPCPHRGFPYEFAGRQPRLSHVVDVRIGAVAGIVLGDPDVSATTRIARRPHVLNHSLLLNAGIAVNPRFTRTVFNTQNSAVIRELAPAMLLCPQFKRYDDIIASLVCQRVMADIDHHVLFGPPFVYQERNAHSLTRDLSDEQWGQENILRVQAALWKGAVTGTITEKVGALYRVLDELMPGVGDLAQAWLQDCERAMG